MIGGPLELCPWRPSSHSPSPVATHRDVDIKAEPCHVARGPVDEL